MLAWLIRRRLRVPSHVTAALLGIDDSTVRHALALTASLIHDSRIPIPPPQTPPPEKPIRTLAELRDHANRHGTRISIPHQQPTPPHKPH